MNLPLIFSVIIGAIVLFFGRKLFWLCLAAIGFAAGFEVAAYFVHQPSPFLAFTFALVLGFIGALLALFLQKVAIGIAGFLAGGKLATAIAAAFFVQHANYSVVVFVIGGIIGAILLLALFDWALIVLSSFVGAYLISGVLVIPASGATILFIVLVAIGVIFQAAAWKRIRLS